MSAVAERKRTEEANTKPKPAAAADARPEDEPNLYDEDFVLWCFAEADKLRSRRWSELDVPNLIEEIESLAKSLRLSQKASYRLLIHHLLKWQFQPQMRSSSWRTTINRERGHIEDVEEESGTLRRQAQSLVDSVYRRARREAHDETGLPLSTFPPACPYTLEQLRDEEWMPE